MRPRYLDVRREGRIIRVLIEPNHPRFSASLSNRVKAELTEEGRYKLCELLMGRFGEALDREPDNPIEVTIGEDTYALHRDPMEPSKVRIRFAPGGASDDREIDGDLI